MGGGVGPSACYWEGLHLRQGKKGSEKEKYSEAAVSGRGKPSNHIEKERENPCAGDRTLSRLWPKRDRKEERLGARNGRHAVWMTKRVEDRRQRRKRSAAPRMG